MQCASKSRFRGALLGALIGDCMGAYWERASWVGTHPIEDVKEKIESQIKAGKSYSLYYTDDTALTFAMAESLVQCREYKGTDMAKKFTSTFFDDPSRGYGASIGTVFAKLREGSFADPYGPAREQFEGRGSYGNGSCMRTSPGALFGCKDERVLVEVCTGTAKITHAHPSAINGALLQAFAVCQALHSEHPLADPVKLFLDELETKMAPLESSTHDQKTYKQPSVLALRLKKLFVPSPFSDGECPSLPTYRSQLQHIRSLLHGEGSADEVQDTLGHGIKAVEAAPCALYAFLHCCNKSFEDLIPYAISLGGDTDTIASMAGAIGGAYWGEEGIPRSWIESCEGYKRAQDLADQLFEIVEQGHLP